MEPHPFLHRPRLVVATPALLAALLALGVGPTASTASPASVSASPRATAAKVDPRLDRRCRDALRRGVTAVFCDRRAGRPPARLHAAKHRSESRRTAARGRAALYGTQLKPGQTVTLKGGRTTRSAHVVLLIADARGGAYVRFSRFPKLGSRKAVITSRRAADGTLVVRLKVRGRSVRPVLQRTLAAASQPAGSGPAAPVHPAGAAPSGDRFAVAECNGAPPRAGAAPSAFDALWRRSGSAWTGGDGTYSVPLPDGRILWLFGDTFLGGVTEAGARAAGSTMVNNAFVVQDDNCLTTLAGGTRERPAAMIPTGDAGSWYWPGAGHVHGSTLTVAASRFDRTGSGPWDWRFTGNALAVLSLPDLRLRRVVALPGGARVAWGVAFHAAGEHAYVYGVEDLGMDKRLHVARAPLGDLTAPWEYYDGAAWSSDPNASTGLLTGVSNIFSVLPAADGVRLVTQRPLTDRIVVHRAPSPVGPWDEGTDIAKIPDPGAGRLTYNALAHPELSANGELLLSYNVIALEHADLYAAADAYRPRFLTAAALG